MEMTCTQIFNVMFVIKQVWEEFKRPSGDRLNKIWNIKHLLKTLKIYFVKQKEKRWKTEHKIT